jgi:hypothetical protein
MPLIAFSAPVSDSNLTNAYPLGLCVLSSLTSLTKNEKATIQIETSFEIEN